MLPYLIHLLSDLESIIIIRWRECPPPVGHFNFTAVLPQSLPARLAYPALLKKMAKPAMLMKFGHIGIEFCHYEPPECPWGLVHCSCKQYLENPASYSS